MTTANSINDENTAFIFATAIIVNVNVVTAAAGIVRVTTLFGALQTIVILLGNVTTC